MWFCFLWATLYCVFQKERKKWTEYWDEYSLKVSHSNLSQWTLAYCFMYLLLINYMSFALHATFLFKNASFSPIYMPSLVNIHLSYCTLMSFFFLPLSRFVCSFEFMWFFWLVWANTFQLYSKFIPIAFNYIPITIQLHSNYIQFHTYYIPITFQWHSNCLPVPFHLHSITIQLHSNTYQLHSIYIPITFNYTPITFNYTPITLQFTFQISMRCVSWQRKVAAKNMLSQRAKCWGSLLRKFWWPWRKWSRRPSDVILLRRILVCLSYARLGYCSNNY